MQSLIDFAKSLVEYHPLFGFALDMWVFYLGFVLYAGCQNAIAEKRWLVILPTLPIVLPAGIIDVLFNQTFGNTDGEETLRGLSAG